MIVPTAVVFALALMGLLYFALQRRMPWVTPLRQPRKRHLVTRIICGTLGVGILVAVAVGTWRSVGHSYERAASQGNIRVPTRPQVAEDLQVEVNKGRAIFYFIIRDAAAQTWWPVHAEEYDLKWPEDRNRVFEKRLNIDGISVTYSLSVRRLYTKGASADITVRSEKYSGLGYSYSSHSGGYIGRSPSEVYRTNLGTRAHPPLSIAAPPGTQQVQAICLMIPAAEDDPLKEVSLEEFVASPEVRPSMDLLRSEREPPTSDFPARGLALLHYIGLSSLFLFVAAALLTQLFARRSIAFVGIVAALVLYVALLDRLVLGAHLVRLVDPQDSLRARMIACEQAGASFFFKKTARHEMEAIAQDPKSPEPLRRCAQQD